MRGLLSQSIGVTLLMLGLTGCAAAPGVSESPRTAAGSAGPSAQLSTPTTGTSQNASSAGPSISGLVVITDGDSGKTFHVSVGARITLRLTNTQRWTPPALSGTSVRLVAVDYLTDPGFSEWSVVPVSPGRSTVTSTGEPNCGSGSACPTEKTQFRVDIDVK